MNTLVLIRIMIILAKKILLLSNFPKILNYFKKIIFSSSAKIAFKVTWKLSRLNFLKKLKGGKIFLKQNASKDRKSNREAHLNNII